MLICDLTKIKNKRLICGITGEPCFFQKYCEIKMKWIQTDGAARCKARRKHEQRNNETDS